MSGVCVIDTTVASLLFDVRPQLAPYLPHLQGQSVCISFQTVAEMQYGALKRGWGIDRRHRLAVFLSTLNVVGYTESLAEKWAIVMMEAQTAGRRLEAGDAWIAATALLLNAPLLTQDKDFDTQACPSLTIISYAL